MAIPCGDTKALLAASVCYKCLTPRQRRAAVTWLICQWVNAGIGCGTATNTLSVTGAGDPTANGKYYYQPADNSWIGPPSFGGFDNWRIILRDKPANSGIFYWEMAGQLGGDWYDIPQANFPCGAWTTTINGTPPAPTVAYSASTKYLLDPNGFIVLDPNGFPIIVP